MTKLLALINLAFCVPIIVICILQIVSDAARKFIIVWAAYTTVLVGGLCSGLQPIFMNAWPNIAEVVLSAGVALLMWLNFKGRRFSQ